MKNFPDHDQLNELEKRLRDYSDQPDELVWENIDSALRPHHRPGVWAPWMDRAIFATAALLFVTAFWLNDSVDMSTVKDQVNEKEIRKDNSKAETATADLSNGNNKSTDHGARIHSATISDSRKETNRTILNPHSANNNESRALSGITTHPDEMVIRQGVQSGETSTTSNADPPATDSLAVIATLDSMSQDKAQEKSSTRRRKIRPRLYASFTPSLSFHRAAPKSDDIVITEISNASIISDDRFGFSIDAGIQGRLSKRWEYYGGIAFYHQNQTLHYTYLSDDVEVEADGDKNYKVLPKSVDATVSYEMTNVGIQAGLLYNLYGKRLRHKFGAGLVYQYGLEKSKLEEYENSQSSYLSYQIFYRNEVRVGARWSVFVQPVFTQSFLVNEKLDAPFDLKPYRAGIGFGILYDF